MANSTVTLTFEVREDGSLVKVQQNINKASKATKDLGAAQDSAAKGANRHSDAINGGVASANNGTRGFSKLRDSIDGSNGIVAAYATLATQAFAISAAFNQLRSATQVEQLMRGLEEQSARTGVSLGSTAKNMQAITGYSISMGEAMRGAAQVAAAGFSTSTMEALTQAATDSAVALGRNVPDALDRFIKGTTKLEPELLDEMGIMVKLDQATSQYAQTIGKVPSQLTAAEKRTGYLNAVLEESKVKFEGLSAAVGTNPYDKLAAAFTDLIQNSLIKLNDLGVLEFVEKLAKNSEFLTAGLIYLGSTVIKQVIPGLYGMAASAAAAAVALKKEAAAQHDAVVAAEERAVADRAAAIESAKTLKILDTNKEAYTNYASAVKASTDTEEQKKKALNSIRGSMAANTRQLNVLLEAERLGDTTLKNEIERRKQLTLAYEKQRDAIKGLEDAKARAEVENTAGQAALAKSKTMESIKGKQADAKGSFAESLGKAGSGDIFGAFGDMKEGLGSMRDAMKEASDQAGPLSARLTAGFEKIKGGIGSASSALMGFITNSNGVGRTTTILNVVKAGWAGLMAQIAASGGILNFVKLGFTGLAMSVKILGMAILNAIPIIGQVIFAFQLLMEYGGKVVDFVQNLFRSDAEKKAAEERKRRDEELIAQTDKITDAQKALSDSIANTEQVGQRYRKYLADAGVDAAKQAQALIATGRAAQDLADKMESIYQAREAQQALKDLIDKADKGNAPGLKSALSENMQQTEAYKALSAQYTLANNKSKKSVEQFILTLAKLPNDTAREKAIREEVNALGKANGDTASSVTELGNAFNALDKNAQAYSKAILQSTSVDKLIDDFTAVMNVVDDLNKKLREGGSKEAYVNQISAQITDSVRGLLDSSTLDALNNFKANQQVAAEAQQRADENKGKNQIAYNALLAVSADTNKKLNDSAESYAKTITDGLVAAKAHLENLQTQERTIQSQIALENARYKAFQRLAGETKESARAADAHEEKLKGLEKNRLSIQMNMLDAQIEGIKSQREEYVLKKQAYALDIAALQTQIKSAKLKIEENRSAHEAMARPEPNYNNRFQNEETKRKFKEDLAAQKAYDSFDASQKKYVDAIAILEQAVTKDQAGIDALDASLAAFDKSLASRIKSLTDAKTTLGNMLTTLDAGGLTEEQKRVRDIALDLKIVQEISGDILEREKILLDIRDKQRAAVDKSLPALIKVAKYAKENLDNQLNAITIERDRGRQNLVNRAAELQAATTAKNLTATELVARKAEADLAATRLAIYDSMTKTLKDQAVVTAQIQLVELAYVDTAKDGLEIQQKALDIANSRVDAQQKLEDTITRGISLEAQIAAKKMGVDVNPEVQRRLDLNAAKRTLAIAEEQLQYKIEGIKLEYALLEAQRIQTILDLSSKKKILEMQMKAAQDGKLTEDQRMMLGQLTSSLDTLGKNSYTAIRDIAIATAKQEVSNKRREVDLLSINSSLVNSSDDLLSNVLRSIQVGNTINREAKKGKELDTNILTAGVFKDIPQSIIPDFNAVLDEGQKAIEASTSSIEDVLNRVVPNFSDMDKITADVNLQFKGLATTLKGLTPEAANILSNKQAILTTDTSSTAADKKSAATAGVTSAIAAGFNVGEWNGTKVRGASGLTMDHSDPGHKGGFAYDLRAAGKSDKDMQSFVEGEVLKGAKAIWHGLIYELKDGKISTRTYTPGPKAKGNDIMHERHAHLNYQNAILRSSEVTDSSVRSTEQATTAVAEFSSQLSASTQEMLQGRGTATPVAAETAAKVESPEELAKRTAQELFTAVTEISAKGTAVDTGKIVQNAGYQKFGTDITDKDKVSEMGLSSGGSERLAQYTGELNKAASSIQADLYDKYFGGDKLAAMTVEQAKKAVAAFRTEYTDKIGVAGQQAYEKAFPAGALNDKMTEFWSAADTTMAPFLENLKKLGPEGEFISAIYSGMKSVSTGITSFAADVEKNGVSIQNVAALAATALSAIQSVLSASATAKVSAIDKEIAAEQKRDGKSKESVDKIDALEKKKDSINRKAFNTNKKLMMAQAVISTASAVAQTLGQGGWFAIPLAIAVGAMGAAQLAIIAGTQYESAITPKATAMPSTLSIGKRSDTVDLAKGPNASAGGEVAYLRGSQGTGSNASNYRTIGSAYGGELMRGYGNRGFVVGEKGPEVITPETPISVTPANDVGGGSPINANFSINAIDSQGIQDVLVSQKGNIIKMLREAANASGKSFMEDVNVNVYTRPSVGKL